MKSSPLPQKNNHQFVTGDKILDILDNSTATTTYANFTGSLLTD